MKPIYIDLHIHTSDNPTELDESYDIETLFKKIYENSQEEDFLISLTDHNTVNEEVYLQAIEKIEDKYPSSSIILGAELHIKKYKDDPNSKAYHCHIFFDIDQIDQGVIQKINEILDELYPNKTVSSEDSIPLLEDILDGFDEYDFLLLPHGGQTHSTFHESIRSSEGDKIYDNVLSKSLYYNFFDGFTSRSNSGVEKTFQYFEKIGIDQFVGLITSSDNYNPDRYPEPKSKEASTFIPTWMFASPTFDGLRIALSDSTRFVYSTDKPREWEKSITHVELSNAEIDINVDFTSGLNVIIGASSSGKTLFVDSLNRKLNNEPFDDQSEIPSIYNDRYKVEDIEVASPGGIKPYYIHQNYISSVINTHNQINEIEPLDKLFPDTKIQRKQVSKALEDLRTMIEELFELVKNAERYEKEITKIPSIGDLITTGEVRENFLSQISSKAEELNDNLEYADFYEDIENLESIHEFLKDQPIISHDEKAYVQLRKELEEARDFSNIHLEIKDIVGKHKTELDEILVEQIGKDQKRKEDFEKLIDRMNKYGLTLTKFDSLLKKILAFDKSYETPEKDINGHKLYFEGNIKIQENLIKQAINRYLLNNKKIIDFDKLEPSLLYSKNFSKTQPNNPQGALPEYSRIAKNVYNSISEKDKSTPKIKTKLGEDFETLSPGKKTAVILDLILNYGGDSAPIIIDQPEDNLSSEFMNTELIELIKRVKKEKQIIFVSHNATIPMIGDAQNIILCRNIDNKITISSERLEGDIDDKKVVDHIVAITDGGKQSVKKRFKKYNLKKFN